MTIFKMRCTFAQSHNAPPPRRPLPRKCNMLRSRSVRQQTASQRQSIPMRHSPPSRCPDSGTGSGAAAHLMALLLVRGREQPKTPPSDACRLCRSASRVSFLSAGCCRRRSLSYESRKTSSWQDQKDRQAEPGSTPTSPARMSAHSTRAHIAAKFMPVAPQYRYPLSLAGRAAPRRGQAW
jgi:hypothetical protein